MSMDPINFHAATGGDEYRFVNHNKTDFDSFKEFQKSVDQKFEKIEEKNSKEERRNHLKIWDESLAPRWRGASLAKIDNPASLQARKTLAKNNVESFFINGDPGAGKTYLGYAILRRYIGTGHVSPSQIKVISEEKIMSYALTGFEGRAKFDELFKPKYKVYLLDNVGAKQDYDVRREIPFWEQLIEHIYSNSLTAIFTSNGSPSSFAQILNDSGNSKFRNLVSGRVLTVTGDRVPEIDEDEMGSSNRNSSGKKNVLDSFDG